MKKDALPERIKEKATELGASLTGIAAAGSVLQTPSHRDHAAVHRRFEGGAFIVMALAHPAWDPGLDWWNGRGGTPGNRTLQHIGRSLQNWLKREHDTVSRVLPYHTEKGGIFLKEAAVAAGLGIIGRNNLLITPRYGAGVRLRAMHLPEALRGDDPLAYNPCEGCPASCREACPQGAFRDGSYRRTLCNVRMLADEAHRKEVFTGGEKTTVVGYCRACEQACPVSR